MPNTGSPLDHLNSPLRYPEGLPGQTKHPQDRPEPSGKGPGGESRQRVVKCSVAWQDRPRVTLVRPAANCLKGEKAGGAAGMGVGVGVGAAHAA